jgi:xanthine dehydrogenase YagS FAD-binding subunit
MDAEVLVQHADGADHWVPIEDFHRVPGDTPDVETVLRQGDLIIALRLPAHATERRSHYVKVRDRASFAWALASCAAALRQDADGTVVDVRLAAGGVATKPWRLPQAEQALLGRKLDRETVRRAAEAATTGAAPRPLNAYKVPLLKQTVERALLELGELA